MQSSEGLVENRDKFDYRRDPALMPSIKDGMAHAVMLGAGEAYINPFAVFLRATSLQIGMLASLPPLVGALFQSLSVWIMERFAARKKLIVLSASIQAFLWLPIALIPFLFGAGETAVNLLIGFVIIYHVAYQSSVPIWNSLIGDLVKVETRGSFFGFRNRKTGLATFVALILAGATLHVFELLKLTALGFLVIFLISAVARGISAKWLARYPDPSFQVDRVHKFSFLEFILRTPRSNFARFVFFVAVMNFSAYVAAPYFSLYMLNELGMNYFQYTAVTAIATVTQFLTMHYWGSLSDQFGNRKIMNVCGIGVAIVPFAWLVWSSTIAIFFIQAWAGFMWAGFNLAAANFMFDSVSPPKRARCVAYQSIINTLFILGGSLCGALLVEHLPSSMQIQGIWTPESKFLTIFLVSGFLRFTSVVAFLRLFGEVRNVEHIRHRDLVFRVTALRPLSGATFSLITGRRSRSKRSEGVK